MKFYEIELKTAPIIRFALSVNLEKHKNHFEFFENFLEVCVIEEGTMVREYFDNSKIRSKAGMISCVTKLDGFDSHSEEGRQRHTTVGIDAEYSITLHDTEAGFDRAALYERLRSNRIFLLPDLFYLEEDFSRVVNDIKNISRLNLSPKPGDRAGAIGGWYVLAGMLTDIVLKKLDDCDKLCAPSERVYADDAVKYINEHYRENITVEDIAKHIGISAGYLHRIFRSVKGRSIISYINGVKVSTVISLVKNRGLSLREAAYNVGIEDPSYMSRLFKKVMGVGIREYMKKAETKSDN